MKPSKCMLGDAAHDSGELREQLDERGTKPVIPNRSNRKQAFTFNKRIYKLRDWLEIISPLFVSQPLLYGRFNEFEP